MQTKQRINNLTIFLQKCSTTEFANYLVERSLSKKDAKKLIASSGVSAARLVLLKNWLKSHYENSHLDIDLINAEIESLKQEASSAQIAEWEKLLTQVAIPIGLEGDLVCLDQLRKAIANNFEALVIPLPIHGQYKPSSNKKTRRDMEVTDAVLEYHYQAVKLDAVMLDDLSIEVQEQCYQVLSNCDDSTALESYLSGFKSESTYLIRVGVHRLSEKQQNRLLNAIAQLKNKQLTTI